MSTQHDIIRNVVVRHIADGLTSGDPTAESLARSLITELDAAGINLDQDIRDAIKAGGA